MMNSPHIRRGIAKGLANITANAVSGLIKVRVLFRRRAAHLFDVICVITSPTQTTLYLPGNR